MGALKFEEISTDFALSSNLLQIEKGVPTIRHDCIYLEDLILRRLEISHALIDGFNIREGWTTFVFTPHLVDEVLWNGVQGLPDALGIVRSGMDHEVLMPSGWSTIEIDVADRLIHGEGTLPEPVLAGAIAPKKGQLHLAPLAAIAARRNLGALIGSGASRTDSPLMEDPAFALRRKVLDLLADATELGCRDEVPRPASSAFQAYRLVRKARGILDEQAHDNPRIDSIACELGVTTRSLQRCFLRVLGVSPKQYFLARKLDTAKRVMRGRGHNASVVDVAHELGFASASRFAEQFRRHFGHSPSRVNRITIREPPPA